MHTASLGRASGFYITAQEHFQLANTPGKIIIGHNPQAVAKEITLNFAQTDLLHFDLARSEQNGVDFFLEEFDFAQRVRFGHVGVFAAL